MSTLNQEDNEREMSTSDQEDYEREMSTLYQKDDRSQTPSTSTGIDGHNDEDVSTKQKLQTRFKRLKQTVKRNRKLLKYTFFIVKELVDSILDWLLYYQLSSLEEGLVVGPVDVGTLRSLLVFCCTGTVLGVLDISNRLYDLYTGNPFVDIAFTETLVMYLEDIPQLMIGFIIILCRGNTEVLLALVLKVGIILVASMVTVFLSCGRCHEKQNIKTFSHLFGTVVVLLIAINTFSTLVMVMIDLPVHLAFYVLAAGSDTRFMSYMDNVSIYVDTDHLPFHSSNITWIHLFDIDDILRHGEITSRVTTDPNHMLIQTFYDGMQKNDSDICYRGNETNFKYFVKSTSCILTNGSTLHYHFIYLPPSKRHPFGDIQYNAEKTRVDICDNIPLLQPPRFGYFYSSAKEHLRSFDQDDLMNIRNVWNTRVNSIFDFVKPYKCDTTGSISPHFNPDIQVPCRL